MEAGTNMWHTFEQHNERRELVTKGVGGGKNDVLLLLYSSLRC